MFFVVFESVLLAASCSIDAFTASFAYGSRRTRIPFLSNQIISLICSSFFGISLFFGAAVRHYFPDRLTVTVSFFILLVIGISKLMDSATKSIIRKHNTLNKEALSKEITFSLFNFSFILNLYANPEEADLNSDRIISKSEAAALAVSLSLDGIAVGFGAALGSISIPVAILASLTANTFALLAGCGLGNRLAHTLPFNASWLSGIILICLAISKLAA